MITLELETNHDNGCVYISDINARVIVDDRLHVGELEIIYEEMPEIFANNDIEPKKDSVYEIDIVKLDGEFLRGNPGHVIYKLLDVRFVHMREDKPNDHSFTAEEFLDDLNGLLKTL